MTEKIQGSVEFDAAKALAALNSLIDGLARLGDQSPQAARQLDKLEKQAVAIARSLQAGTTAAQGQARAIENLTSQYNRLGLAQARGANNLSREFQSTLSLAGQRASQAQNAAFGSYSGNIAFSRALDEQERAYQSYSRNILATARASAAEQQRLAYQTYAQNMPAALRQSQRAAYDSYAANIRYSQSQEQLMRGLANQRYALYDVATTWGVVSTATLGAAAVTTKIAIDYQKNFASVARTSQLTGQSLEALRQDLIDLSTNMPVSFEDITQIATLGGQLGIAAEGLDDFTQVVAMLTATTNLSAEAAGTALGRFNALFDDVNPSNFENIGSAIAKVGVNSVATETQIVSIATQISSMGDFAGFTAEQVVGLSGALASVGAQPELSRGTVTRLFTLMSQAVANGGDALNEFARISDVTAADFQSAWGTDRFASVFQRFLKGVADEGQGAVKTLNDLGVSSVRDVPLLLRLAGAQDVVNTAFADAKSGFEDGTELQKQYAVTTNTVADRLTKLGNSIKAVLEAGAGASLGPIAGFLDAMIGIGQALQNIINTPVGRVLGVITISVFGLVGAFTALRAMQAITTASLYAMITAQQGLNNSQMAGVASLRSMTAQMAAMALGTQRVTAAQTAYNASLTAGNGRLASMAAGVRAGATAVNGLAGAFRTAMVASGWLAVIGLGLSALTSFAAKNEEAKARVDALTQSLDQNTGAITENTAEYIKNTFTQDGTLKKARELGVSWDILKGAALGNRDAIAELTSKYEYWNSIASQPVDYDQIGISEEVEEQARAVDEAANKADQFADVLKSVGVISDEVAEAQQNQRYASEDAADGMVSGAEAAAELEGSLQDLIDTQYDVVGGTVAVQNAIYGLGESLAENGLSFDAFSVGGRANLESLQKTLSAMVQASGGDAAALATMVAGLMQTLASYGVDTVNQLAFVQNALAQLTGGKGTTGLTGVGQAAAQAGSALGQGFSVGANKAAGAARKAAKGAGGAAKEIKTLTDYVSDLEGVFRTAFDIRFGLDEAVDGVADAFAKLADYSADATEAVEDAQQAIREADAEIRGLNAANTTLEYQLTVAREYGDTLRANEILAEMAANNADIADQQRDRAKSSKDLSKAESALNKTLDGSTEESREQRDMVLSLVKSYQEQVTALANSGLSQAEVARRTQELKNQFISQLVQMGYNRAEVERYARSFDDLTAAILRVPRNITVTANTDPAQRAIDEFLAKNANRSIGMGSNLNVPDAGSTYGLGQQAGAAYADGWNQSMQARRRLIIQPDAGVPGGQKYSVDGGKTWFLNRGGEVGSGVQYHSTGGVHGLGFKPRGTDTTPAMLTPGEFVQQKKAVEHYGLPFMNALNNMQVPRYLATGGAATGSSSSRSLGPTLVELMPHQLMQLAGMLSTQLTLDGRIVAEATNHNNAVSARRGSN